MITLVAGGEMDFDKFVEWGFLGLIAGSVGWASLFLQRISQSISELNERVAVILEKTGWHARQIENLDERVEKLETRRH